MHLATCLFCLVQLKYFNSYWVTILCQTMWWKHSFPHLILSTLLKYFPQILIYASHHLLSPLSLYHPLPSPSTPAIAQLLDVELGLTVVKELAQSQSQKPGFQQLQIGLTVWGETRKHRTVSWGHWWSVRGGTQVQFYTFKLFVPTDCWRAWFRKTFCTHKTLQILLAPENSYKMKSPYYEYSRVSQHSEGKLPNYVSNYLHQAMRFI